MKTIKGLVLGSAATLVAMGGAQAADLPVKAKAVEYVRVCSLYGAGFYYIPGTDTCVKIGGYLRTDLTVNGGNGGQPFYSGGGAIGERYANYYNDYSRFALTLDTRTATEYGVVRTFGQADFTFGTEGVGNGINLQSSVNTAALNGGAVNNFAGNGGLGLEYAFIQFAGFTLGKSASAYVTPWQGFPGNNTAYLVGGYDTVSGINNVQYTAQFGNGVSLSVGIDDSSANDYNRTQVINAATTNAAAGNLGLYGAASSNVTPLGTAYSGAYVPDFVGNIRVDQAWGLFQVSGAAHWVDGGYFQNGNTTGSQFASSQTQVGAMDSGHPEGKMGFAFMAALQIKNIPTGPGDDFKIEGSVAQGASKYTIGTSGALGGSFYMIHNANNGVGGTEAIGAISDGVFGGAGKTGMQLTDSWGVRSAYNHNWDPYWSSSLFAGAVGLHYNNTAKGLWCSTYSLISPTGNGGITTCDPGFTMWEVGTTTRWTPVKNLTFSTEVMYTQLDTNMRGTVVGTQTSAFPTSNGAYTFKNMGTVEVEFRAQRNF
jgi:Porin subfamily